MQVFLKLGMAFLSLGLLSSDMRAENLIKDSDFINGFEVMSPNKDIYTERSDIEAVFRTSSSLDKPVWRLVQWGSARSIANAFPVAVPGGGISWSAEVMNEKEITMYKRVIKNQSDPLAGQVFSPSLTLELNGLAEFSSSMYLDKNHHQGKASIYLANTDTYWPHLLIVQNLKTKKLSQYPTLPFSMDAHLLFDEKNIHDGYLKELHAGRFIVSMAVHNTLSGNLFWLNLVIYDDRYSQTDFGCQKCRNRHDCYTPKSLDNEGKWLCPFDGTRWSKTSEKKGTQRMIFRLPTNAITKGDIQQGEWTHYSLDLIPYIKAGIQAAQDEEKLRGFSSSLMFYNLTLFAMGWEVTGLNHAAMEVKNLSLSDH